MTGAQLNNLSAVRPVLPRLLDSSRDSQKERRGPVSPATAVIHNVEQPRPELNFRRLLDKHGRGHTLNPLRRLSRRGAADSATVDARRSRLNSSLLNIDYAASELGYATPACASSDTFRAVP